MFYTLKTHLKFQYTLNKLSKSGFVMREVKIFFFSSFKNINSHHISKIVLNSWMYEPSLGGIESSILCLFVERIPFRKVFSFKQFFLFSTALGIAFAFTIAHAFPLFSSGCINFNASLRLLLRYSKHLAPQDIRRQPATLLPLEHYHLLSALSLS